MINELLRCVMLEERGGRDREAEPGRHRLPELQAAQAESMPISISGLVSTNARCPSPGRQPRMQPSTAARNPARVQTSAARGTAGSVARARLRMS